MSASYDRSETSPVARLVNAIRLVSLKKRASQIVVRRAGNLFVVELEIDGQMHEEMKPPVKLAVPIFERIAMMADVPIVRAGETGHGRFVLEVRDQYSEFMVEVRRSRDRAHASIRMITAAELDKLD